MKYVLRIIGFFYFFSIMIMSIENLYAQKVQLIWESSSEPTILNYGIYRSTHIDSTFTLLDNVSHPDSIYADESITETHYCYAVTAIDSFGNESNFSNIVEIDVPTTPVELSTFAARAEGSNAILEWSTASESNNYGFEIQRRENIGGDFKRTGFEKGRGTTSELNIYHFVDCDLPQGTYLYRLKQIDYDGTFEFSNNAEVTIGQPREFKLYQNYPNPFNPTTTISYSLPQSGHVELTIYNIKGEEICRLVDGYQRGGEHTVKWDGINFEGAAVSSGLYIYKIKSFGKVEFRRMVFLR